MDQLVGARIVPVLREVVGRCRYCDGEVIHSRWKNHPVHGQDESTPLAIEESRFCRNCGKRPES